MLSLSPARISAATGNSVQVLSQAGVDLGVDQTNISSTTGGTQLTFTMPSVSGTGNDNGVLINVAGGTGASAAISFQPTIVSLSPSSGAVSGGYPVTITGTNFNTVGGNTIRIHNSAGNGITSPQPNPPPSQAAGYTFPSGADLGNVTTSSRTQITFIMPNLVGANVNNGIVIEVFNEGNNTGASSPNSNTVVNFTFPLVVTSVVNQAIATPSASYPANTGSVAGGYKVLIGGVGFTTATSVSFGTTNFTLGTPAAGNTFFSVSGDTQITLYAPSGSAASTVVIVVTTTGPNSSSNVGTSTGFSGAGDQFTFQAPTISSNAPNSGDVVGGTSVTITGQYLTGANPVSFGGTASSSVTVSSDTSITASSPSHAAGTVTVSVQVGSSVVSAPSPFTYLGPSVTGISPTTGQAVSTAGTTVTITGTGLADVTSVSFGGAPLTQGTAPAPTRPVHGDVGNFHHRRHSYQQHPGPGECHRDGQAPGQGRFRRPIPPRTSSRSSSTSTTAGRPGRR